MLPTPPPRRRWSAPAGSPARPTRRAALSSLVHRRLLLHALGHLLANEVEAAVEQRAELLGIDNLERARARKIDCDQVLDEARRRGHHSALVACTARLI